MRRAGRLFRCCRAPADRTSRSATCWPLGKAARTGPACKCSAPQHRRSRPTESPWPGRTHSRGSLARSCKRGPRSASPNEVFQFWQDRRESWSVLEIGGPNPVDLDGLGVNWPIRVEPGAPRLALAPALAFAQHFHETDFDDDARSSPRERLLADKLGVGCTLASRLRVEGDEPVETIEEIRQVHRGPPKQPEFLRASLIGVTASDRMTPRFRKPD